MQAIRFHSLSLLALLSNKFKTTSADDSLVPFELPSKAAAKCETPSMISAAASLHTLLFF